MTKEWWYAIQGQKHGPVSKSALQSLLHENKITTQTLVWSEGLTDWTSIEQLEELHDIARTVPPALPVSTSRQRWVELPPAGPWRRFFARHIDLMLLALFLGFFVAVGLAYTSTSFVNWIQEPGSDTVFGWLLVPLILLVEGCIFALFGNTPGKALLGIVITTTEAEKITPRHYFDRLINVWWGGLGTGFPLASLFTMLFQYRKLKMHGHTSYDREKFNVKAHKLSAFRYIIVTLVLVMIWGTATLVSAY